MISYKKVLLGTLILSLFMLGACQKNTKQPVSTALPKSINFGVVGFTQPTTISALLTGTLPRVQGLINAQQLNTLNNQLTTELNKVSRNYTYISTIKKVNRTDFSESQNPQALKKWLKFGKEHNLDMLLVPQVINWNDRQGTKVGVDSSAHIKIELYLLDIKNDKIFDIAFFEEQQIGLANNLLNVGSFLKRSGSWITASEMAQEAIIITVKELNL